MGFLKNIFDIKCPYCGGDLEKKPGRKKKYLHCENYIYVREGEIQAQDGMGVQLGDILDTKLIIRNALIRLAMRKFIIVVRS